MPVLNLRRKICATCGFSFRPNSGIAKYCSAQCHLKANVFREPRTGCLEHMGTGDKDGYVNIVISGRRRVRAHRLSFELEKGPIPVGMEVCHSCDNPPCIDVDHLFLGTSQDNKIDSMVKARHARGKSVGTNILTEDQALAISMDKRNRRVIAREYGVKPSHVDGIRTGKCWNWLTGKPAKSKRILILPESS